MTMTDAAALAILADHAEGIAEAHKIARGQNRETAAAVLDEYNEARAHIAARLRDAERLDWLSSNRLGLVPLEAGGWDVIEYDDEDGKETLLCSRSTARTAIDDAQDASPATGGEGVQGG